MWMIADIFAQPADNMKGQTKVKCHNHIALSSILDAYAISVPNLTKSLWDSSRPVLDYLLNNMSMLEELFVLSQPSELTQFPIKVKHMIQVEMMWETIMYRFPTRHKAGPCFLADRLQSQSRDSCLLCSPLVDRGWMLATHRGFNGATV
jgi:hypothetical protein